MPHRDSPRRGPTRRETPAPSTVDAPRMVARDVLRAVRGRDSYANLILPSLLRERKLSGRDAAFATELAYGACRAQGLLDAIIAAGAGRPVEEMDGQVIDVLRLAAYQLLRTRVAPHAAVSTAVAMARESAGERVTGFVNAVLRRVSEKTEEQWVAELAPKDPVGRLAFTHAHPRWIAQSFVDALGADATELDAALAADDTRPVVHLAARPGDITAEELALSIGGEEGKFSPYAVYLDGGDPGSLEPVRDGLATVQDEGSQLVALATLRAPVVGEDTGRWLDLCSGPGGKAAMMGAIARIDGAHLDAVELAPHRVKLVRTSTEGLPVTVLEADGRDPGLSGGYDRVLVDAPCTGLGALRRRPEARWRKQPSDVSALTKLQRELLESALKLVRPGGVVVYSTCSPHIAETVGVVGPVIRKHSVEVLSCPELLPEVPRCATGPDGAFVQLWPHRHGTDAMFVAVLRKPE
nr:transcription antitermination factor NusB [Hoyosella rhizosphaerae]